MVTWKMIYLRKEKHWTGQMLTCTFDLRKLYQGGDTVAVVCIVLAGYSM